MSIPSMCFQEKKKMFTTFRKLLAVAPLFLCAAAGFAQSTFSGDVKGVDGKPLQGAVIKIDRTDIKQSFEVKTKKDGHFLHANLPSGTYNVTLWVDGKEIDRITGIQARGGDIPPFLFDLKAAAAAAAAGAAVAPPGASVNKEMTKEERAEYDKKLKEREAAMAKDKALQDAFNAGMEAKNLKNYSGAVENFEKASVLGPTQHVVWAQLAESYITRSDGLTGDQKQADIDKGIAAYAKAVELKGDDPGYHNNYALALVKAKKLDLAEDELMMAADLDPLNAGKYYYNLGAVLVNAQQSAAAEGAFKKAIEVDPTYADAHYQYALVLMSKVTLDKDGKMLAAPGTIEALQQYLALRPDGANAEGAKAILEQLGSKVQTSFERPGTAKGKQPANQKKSK